MEKQELRRYDFIWSIVLFVFGVWMLSETMKMPMKDTWGGVENVWYVSPGLMPLVVSIGLMALSAVLFFIALKEGGAKGFTNTVAGIFKLTSEGNVKFFTIVMALMTYVYLFLPRVDFFISSAFFLFFLITIFYLNDYGILKKLSIGHLAGSLVFLALFSFRAHVYLDKIYYYNVDILVTVFAAVIIGYTIMLIRTDREKLRRFKYTVIVSLSVPLLLSVGFRFMLLVPLPKEGAVVDTISNIYYMIKY